MRVLYLAKARFFSCASRLSSFGPDGKISFWVVFAEAGPACGSM